jgi:hypothetical protein
MNKRFFIPAILLISASFVGGCSTYSGPLQTTEVISTANGGMQYRVQCGGLFSSSSACVKQMRKICGDRRIQQLQVADSKGLSLKSGNDPRSVTFTCVAEAPNAAGTQSH